MAAITGFSDFKLLAESIPELLVDTPDAEDPEVNQLIKFLRKTKFGPLDLIKLEQYKDTFEDTLGELLETVYQELLFFIGTEAFAKELDRALALLKDPRDLQVIQQVKYFLEHEDQEDYDLQLSAELLILSTKIKDRIVSEVCKHTVMKIHSMIKS